GDIDLYPEYTGTLLANQEAVGLAVPPERSSITGLVRRELRRKHDLELLEPFGLNNTYVLCVPPALAQKFRLKTISDLRRTSGLRTAVDLDFLDRSDGWKGLVATYGLELAQPKIMNPDLRWKALQSGEVDVVLGFATDWEIAFYGLVVLEDDRGYFPTYY